LQLHEVMVMNKLEITPAQVASEKSAATMDH
jgi:hypothetical protein